MDPTTYIPHRPPFVLVDDVEIVEPGRRAIGRWTPGLERFAGHFPGNPMLPGVLQVESIAQVGAAGLLACNLVDAMPVFAGLEKVRWRRPVRPGDTLDIEIELDELRHRIGRGSGWARVEGDLCCEARILFAVVPVPSAQG